jgi:outer membrane putative beta-barrel porin/alpha-amylase
MAMKQLIQIAGFLIAVSCTWVRADEDKPAEKSRFTLFNPTPRELMREMSTDRPDKTESPYTVDAGHFQIEADILNYAYDRHNTDFSNTRVETVSIAPVNLKAGLCNNVDLQLVIETYTSVRTHDRSTGVVQRNRGFGDITPRLKWNVWGNDGGSTALALMPFVKLPTNQDDLGNDSVEGGLIVPFAVELPYGWGMGLMTEFDIIRDEVGSGHHVEFVNSITFAHDICGNLRGYVEFWSAVSTESGSDWTGSVDLGLTYALTDDIQLDGGANFGVTRSADDINPFLGISWRF